MQTGTLISYSIRGGARLGSTLQAASVETDPDYLKSSHKAAGYPASVLSRRVATDREPWRTVPP